MDDLKEFRAGYEMWLDEPYDNNKNFNDMVVAMRRFYSDFTDLLMELRDNIPNGNFDYAFWINRSRENRLICKRFKEVDFDD